MLYTSFFSIVERRFYAISTKVDAATDVAVKTTYDTGKELEDRVARLLRKRGHINIKQNQRVKDKNGNLSEFDVVYGWPIHHYVECKNYSSPVKLEMVAKFKEVLSLHRIPKSRGLFITTSTYTPRATTIGITCIDGTGLQRLEQTATAYLLMKICIVIGCGIGSYYLYNFLLTSDTPKTKKWREGLTKKSHEVAQKSVEAVQQIGGDLVITAADIVDKQSAIAAESVVNAVDAVKAMLEQKNGDSPFEVVHVKTPEDDIWEAPSILHCIEVLFKSFLGISG